MTKIWVCVLALLSVAAAEPNIDVTTGTVVLANRVKDDIHMSAIGWESNTSGTVTAKITDFYGLTSRIVIVPDDEPTSAPADSYDVTLKDADGVDILDAMGADLSSVSLTTIGTTWTLPFLVFGDLDLEILNADVSRGLIRVYYTLPSKR